MYFFFFNDTATTEIYTLSLHDALPISDNQGVGTIENDDAVTLSIDDVSLAEGDVGTTSFVFTITARSEEHTSELQSRQYLVCRLLLEKKKKNKEQSNRLLVTWMIQTSN